jgi:hypothetical protein
MGRGDQYQQKRFTVPCSSGDVPGGHWPLVRSTACCKCAASRRFYHAPTKSWLCGQCLAAQPKETR